MKRLDLGMIGGALLSLSTAVVMSGCNNDTIYDEYEEYNNGDSLKITEQVILKCDEPFVFSVVSDFNTTVTIKTDEEEDTIHSGEFGVDIKYIVLSECNNTECPDTNETIAPIRPVNGFCPVGFVISDCNANECLPVICDDGETLDGSGSCAKDLTCGDDLVIDDNNTCVIPTRDCGVGTEYNATTELCEAVPPLECGKGLVTIEDVCIAKVYKLEDDECIDGYTEGNKGYFCFLDDNDK